MSHKEFTSHRLNESGLTNAVAISQAFDTLLDDLVRYGCKESREFSIMKTKLEEACFFAKKSMATQAEFQVVSNG